MCMIFSSHSRLNVSVGEAYAQFRTSDEYWSWPPSVRVAFHKVHCWLPQRATKTALAGVNARFARALRDKAARERGWKFGNYALLLLQSIINAAVHAGALSNNRVKQVPKLLPPSLPPSTCRRRIRSVRQPIYSSANLSKRENSSV